MKKIGILENDINLRTTAKEYLSDYLNYEVVFALGSIQDLNGAKNIVGTPDVILLDINLDDSNGIDTVLSVRVRFPVADILIMTGEYELKMVNSSVEMGISGFLYKPFSMATLKAAIENINHNDYYFDPLSLSELVETIQSKRREKVVKDTSKKFTKTEKAVIEYLKLGWSMKQIAQAMNISVNTVNFHMKNLFVKTNVHSRSELICKIMS
jgi:DNA-binding NarL/FixJ family response regulator